METTFGDLVHFKREMLEMSMRELAKRVEVDVAYISKIEKGRTFNPSYSVVVRIAKELYLSDKELKKAFQLDDSIETIIGNLDNEKEATAEEIHFIKDIIEGTTQIIRTPQLDTDKIGELFKQILQFHEKKHRMYYVISIIDKNIITILQTPIKDDKLINLYYKASYENSEENSFIIEGNIIQSPEFEGDLESRIYLKTLQDLLNECNYIDEDDDLYDERLELKEYLEKLNYIIK